MKQFGYLKRTYDSLRPSERQRVIRSIVETERALSLGLYGGPTSHTYRIAHSRLLNAMDYATGLTLVVTRKYSERLVHIFQRPL